MVNHFEQICFDLMQAITGEDFDKVTSIVTEKKLKDKTILVTAIIGAAQVDHLEILKYLLSVFPGTDEACVDEQGRSPLHVAIWFGSMDCVKYLIGAKPGMIKLKTKIKEDLYSIKSIKERNEDHGKPPAMEPGSSCLHLATQRVNIECFNLLINAGANVNELDDCGLTPFDVAGEKLSEKVKEDLEQEQKTSDSSLSALQTVGRSLSKKFTRDSSKPGADNFLGLIKALKEARGVKSKENIKYRTTPLHVAVELDSDNAIAFLHKVHYDVQMKDKIGNTALHIAVAEQRMNALKALVKYTYGKTEEIQKELLNIKNKRGENPLHIAVKYAWIAGIKYLLKTGADVNSETKKKQTVLHLAAMLKSRGQNVLEEFVYNPEILKIVDNKDENGITAFFHAIASKQINNFETILKVNPNMTMVDKIDPEAPKERNGRNVLHYTLEKKQHKMFKILFKHLVETKVDIKEMMEFQYKSKCIKGTPLHLAVYLGEVSCVETLMENDCDLDGEVILRGHTTNKGDPDALHTGSNVLHLAAFMNKVPVLRAILYHARARKEMNEVDGERWLPIHVACYKRSEGCIKLFVRNGSKLSATCTYKGKELTAVCLAIKRLPFSANMLKQMLDSSIQFKRGNIEIDYNILLGGSSNMLVMEALLKNENDSSIMELFSHSLIQSFLYLQWQRLKWFYSTFVFMFLLFVASLSVQVVGSCHYKNAGFTEEWSIAARSIVAIMVFFLTLHDLISSILIGWKYVIKLECLVKLLCYILAIAVAILSWDLPREIATAVILLSWIELMLLISHIPSYGTYMVMFFEVSRNFFKIIVSFIFLLIAFMIVFLIQFEHVDPFKSEVLVKSIVMMAGELDYGSLVFPEGSKMYTIIFSKIMFVLFIFLIGIIFMNILTTNAINDVNQINQIRNQAIFIKSYQEIYYNDALMKYLPGPMQRWMQSTHLSEKVEHVSDEEQHELLEKGPSTKNSNSKVINLENEFPDDLWSVILKTAYQNSDKYKKKLKEDFMSCRLNDILQLAQKPTPKKK